MQTHYNTPSPKSKLQRSPFSLEENLAAGRAAGLQEIQHACLFDGKIHICRLKAMAGGDPQILNELLAEADKRDVKVKYE